MPEPQVMPYSGYFSAPLPAPEEDVELTRIGPGTPCGEYMRRFWQPVALSSEITDLPLAVTLLGENLVLFRTRGGSLGLLHRHCVHRGTSLEYGRVEEEGVRCCYHGWLYGVDGRILETPLEPESSPIRRKVCIGAYPVHECRGIVFAYLGPPEHKPEFPVYDTFEMPDTDYLSTAHHFPTNWFQLVENNFDMAHVVYLHTLMSPNAQFYDTWGVLPRLEYRHTPSGVRYTYSRRIEDHVWVGLEDIVLPNFTQAGAIFSMDGKRQKYFGRGSYSRWLVPLDDVNTRVYVLGHFNERSDPFREEYALKENLEVMEAGTRFERSYEERQREPSDLEAAGSQGRIYLRRNEHLATTDKGVALFRRRLREAVRGLAAGRAPAQPADAGARPIPTCAGDTVLPVPRREGEDDEVLIDAVARAVMDRVGAGDHLCGAERDQAVIRSLRELEREHQVGCEIQSAG